MNTYRPNRRDPLTMRFARSVSDTIDDPYRYSEGPAEQSLLIIERPSPSFSRVCNLGHLIAWLVPVVITIVVVIAGLFLKVG